MPSLSLVLSNPIIFSMFYPFFFLLFSIVLSPLSPLLKFTMDVYGVCIYMYIQNHGERTTHRGAWTQKARKAFRGAPKQSDGPRPVSWVLTSVGAGSCYLVFSAVYKISILESCYTVCCKKKIYVYLCISLFYST